ncbi:MAG: hypothetical protein PHV02_14325 [Rhodocyclaceae bacterium]|nr:hypothetical protein [Rhodocyclaceae bacterium]
MIRRYLLILTLLVPALAAKADERLMLSGFGTLGAAWFSNETADFSTNTQPIGPGRSKTIDFGLDSRLGGQADIELGKHLQFTLQGIIQRRPGRDFKPEVSLAHLRWHPVENFSLRLGRTQDNSFLASEYRLANLPNPWVRPPPEVYGLIPLIYEDGLDANWRQAIGNGHLDLSLSLGRGDFSVARSNEAGLEAVDIRQTQRLVARWQGGNWQAKASYGTRQLSYAPAALQPAIDMVTRIDPASGAQLAIQDVALQTWTLGLAYDSDDWLLMAEWAQRRSVSAFADASGAYVLAGYRFGQTMPYAGIARRVTDGASVSSRNPLATAIIDEIYASQERKNITLTLGLNVALTPTVILRSQIDFIRAADNTWGAGPYNNHAPDYNDQHPPRERLISVGVDFIF